MDALIEEDPQPTSEPMNNILYLRGKPFSLHSELWQLLQLLPEKFQELGLAQKPDYWHH